MTDDTLQDIANESDGSFSGDIDYNSRKSKSDAPSRIVTIYKIANRNPQKPDPDFKPGILMITKSGPKDSRQVTTELTQQVKAVILFTSHGRELGRGTGPAFRVACQSHDAEYPSLRVDEPLCRHTKTQDLVQIFSQWKGFDKAKVDAKVKEVTEGTDSLRMCGLKSANGFINLCKYSKKDPITGARAACKSHIYARCYDIERKREFDLKLTGSSIDNNIRFVAPFHEFFQFLRQSLDGKGLPCHAFHLKLSALPKEGFFYLGVSDWKPIADANNRSQMKELALAARDRYNKEAAFLSKEAYEKQRGSQSSAPAKQAPPPPPPQEDSPPPPPQAPDRPVSFADDDIPF